MILCNIYYSNIIYGNLKNYMVKLIIDINIVIEIYLMIFVIKKIY